MSDEHIIDFVQEQRVRLLDEVRQIMLGDPILEPFEPLLTVDLMFPQPEDDLVDARSRVSGWVGQGDMLTVLHSSAQGKFTLLGFRVDAFGPSDMSVVFDEVTVDLVLYVYVSRIGPDPFPIHIITPQHDQPVRYRQILGKSRGEVLDAIDISTTDLMNRFPGQVENILTQIGFLAQVFLGLGG